MAGKNNHKQNKFIQLLSLSILVLGLGTSALLVQQKMYNSKAAVGAPPPPVCPADKPFFCGGCINACTNTGSLNCTQYIALHCGTPQPATPRPPTAPPSASCFTSQVGAKRCSGNYVQTCLSNLQWANTQLCSSGCSGGVCISPTPAAACKTICKYMSGSYNNQTVLWLVNDSCVGWINSQFCGPSCINKPTTGYTSDNYPICKRY